MDPTQSPSTEPSSSPTKSPITSAPSSKSPITHQPTTRPFTNHSTSNESTTAAPSTSPPATNISITNSQTTNEAINSASIVPSYHVILMIVGTCFIIVAVMGYINAKCVNIDDFYSIAAIIAVMCYIFDLYSDISICMIIYQRIMDRDIFLWLFIASLIFIILPIMVSMAQLLNEINKHWMKDDEIKLWLTENSKLLFLLSFICGSSFTAIELMNSNLFQIYSFSMALSREQFHRYMAKSIYSIVILEVLLCYLYLLRIICLTSYIIYIHRIFHKWHYKQFI